MRLSVIVCLLVALVACSYSAVATPTWTGTSSGGMPTHLNCDVFNTAITFCSNHRSNLMVHRAAWCSSCCFNQNKRETGFITSPFTVTAGFFVADLSGGNPAMVVGMKDQVFRPYDLFAGAGAIDVENNMWPEEISGNDYTGPIATSSIWNAYYVSVATVGSEPYAPASYQSPNVNPLSITSRTGYSLDASGNVKTMLTDSGSQSTGSYFNQYAWEKSAAQRLGLRTNDAWGSSPGGRDTSKREVSDELVEELAIDDEAATAAAEVSAEERADSAEASSYEEIDPDQAREKELRHHRGTCSTWWSNRNRDYTCFARVLAYYARANIATGQLVVKNTQNVGATDSVGVSSGAYCLVPVPLDYVGEAFGFGDKSPFTGSGITASQAGGSNPFVLDVCIDNFNFCSCCWQNYAAGPFPSWDVVVGPGAYIDTSSSFGNGNLGDLQV